VYNQQKSSKFPLLCPTKQKKIKTPKKKQQTEEENHERINK